MNIRRYVTTLVTVAGYWFSAETSAAVVHYEVALTGFQEVNASGQFNQGDPDGFGVADLRIDAATFTIEWDFMVANIALPLTGAHIHQNVAGQNGPVVVNFNGQLSGSGFNDPDLANVIANPKDFYVNLHNADFPNGAIRGQIGDPLPAPVPLPAAMWLFGPGLLGLLGIAARKRRRDAWPDTPHPE